jgi:hypothetical protein
MIKNNPLHWYMRPLFFIGRSRWDRGLFWYRAESKGVMPYISIDLHAFHGVQVSPLKDIYDLRAGAYVIIDNQRRSGIQLHQMIDVNISHTSLITFYLVMEEGTKRHWVRKNWATLSYDDKKKLFPEDLPMNFSSKYYERHTR